MVLKFEKPSPISMNKPQAQPLRFFNSSSVQSPQVLRSLTIYNDISTATIQANYQTGLLEIEHELYGLIPERRTYTFTPFDAILFLNAHDLLLSANLKGIQQGRSGISCVHAMNSIASTALLIK